MKLGPRHQYGASSRRALPTEYLARLRNFALREGQMDAAYRLRSSVATLDVLLSGGHAMAKTVERVMAALDEEAA